MYTGLRQQKYVVDVPSGASAIETPYSFRPAPTDPTLKAMRVWYATNPPSWLGNTLDQAYFRDIYGPKALAIALRFGLVPENSDPNFSYESLDQSQWDLFADDGSIVHSGTDWWLMDIGTIEAAQWHGDFTPTAGGILPIADPSQPEIYVSQLDAEYQEHLAKIADEKRRREEAAAAAAAAASAAAEAARLAAAAEAAAAEAARLAALGDTVAAAAAVAEAARLKAAADAAAAEAARIKALGGNGTGEGGGATLALAAAAYWIFFA
jgi:hypothetical protein